MRLQIVRPEQRNLPLTTVTSLPCPKSLQSQLRRMSLRRSLVLRRALGNPSTLVRPISTRFLSKTGLHAPLSSSKLVRSTSNRIAPLHLSRRTPPPPPPPISKPKKKVVEDEEDEPDFTGMTKKQIDKYWEEKKNRAWYSP
ncbi:hypothetical protein FRC18_010340 [Serendipita sp. 400]|nr:hypothetical protein FRC18_010340 [Serendipita sp. 400]